MHLERLLHWKRHQWQLFFSISFEKKVGLKGDDEIQVNFTILQSLNLVWTVPLLGRKGRGYFYLLQNSKELMLVQKQIVTHIKVFEINWPNRIKLVLTYSPYNIWSSVIVPDRPKIPLSQLLTKFFLPPSCPRSYCYFN